MRRARYEILPDDGSYHGEIEGFPGVHANAATLEACRDELTEVLEERIVLRLARQLAVPVVAGLELRICQVA